MRHVGEGVLQAPRSKWKSSSSTMATTRGQRSIQAFRIRFASGFEIIGLSSAPRSLRGKQGVVMIDEAAFVDNLKELLKAALAFLMRGGQVVVCSTHNGTETSSTRRSRTFLAAGRTIVICASISTQALQEGFTSAILPFRDRQAVDAQKPRPSGGKDHQVLWRRRR